MTSHHETLGVKSEQSPTVMIECSHLLIIKIGAQISCGTCGSVWGGSPYPANWDKRVKRAVRLQSRPPFWRRVLRWWKG